MQKLSKFGLYTLVAAMLLFAFHTNGYAQKKGKKGKEETKTEQPQTNANAAPAEADALLKEAGGKWGPDSAETVKNYSLYREYYKQNLYKDALPYWRFVINNAPGARKTPYIDGEKMYKSFLEQQIEGAQCKDGSATTGYSDEPCKDKGGFTEWKYKNKAIADAYFDTLFQLYDKRGQAFNEMGYVNVLKARTLAAYKPQETDAIIALRQKAIKEEAEDAPYDLVYAYFKDAVSLYNAKKITQDSVFAIQEALADITANNIESNENPDYVALYQQVQDVMSNWREKVEAASKTVVTKSSDCNTVVQVYGEKFRANMNDLTTVKQVFSKLKSARCTTDPLYFDVLIQMNNLEPSASQSRFIAQQYQKKSDFSNAIKYYNKSLETETDPAKQAKVYMQLAKMEQVHNGNLSQARKYAKKAADLQPGSGEPYLFIGDLYMRSKGSCTDDGLDGHSVYWVAADMYARAKDIDPSVASKASEKYSNAAKGFPNKENLFFRGYNIGGPFTVRCWIQQSTTIR